MHFFDKIALSTVHFLMNVYHMSVTWGLYIRFELCGYCMVIVWLLCGACGEIKRCYHPMVAQTGKWSEYFTLSTSHFIGVRLREQRI